MSGYAAASRVIRGTPRTATPLGTADQPERDGAAADATATIVTGPDDDRGAAMFRLSERWAAARQRWSQLTFYLFDPDSWR